MRMIDIDTLIEDLQYDIKLNELIMESQATDEAGRKFAEFDKDCKREMINLLESEYYRQNSK